METKKYDFGVIFTYNPGLNSLIPKYDVIVNGRRYRKGVPIFKHLDQLLSVGGLNLFNYIGQDIAGKWDAERKELNIVGFY